MKHIKLGIFFSAVLCTFSVPADPALKQTKTKLMQLDAQINQVKQILASAHNKQEVLNQELAATEKEIGEGVKQLRLLQQDIEQKQQKIKQLQQRSVALDGQLLKQQQLFRKHVRLRYKMGEYQPIKWLLNQDNPFTFSRLLTFHQYILHSRQNLIADMDKTKQSLSINQQHLKTALAAQEHLKDSLSHHQQALEQKKHYHTSLLRSLGTEIESKLLTLSEYKRNKENLSQLVQQLSIQSIASPQQPFFQMRKKLPKPVSLAAIHLQKMNQGVAFFAGEGTPVQAVYPGKVVFSDWLKGYGLLLILDHGQGYMTLYAHNQSLFKTKGSQVMQGEQIAAVGHSGGLKQNGLYFEVRHRGKAIPPLDWLS